MGKPSWLSSIHHDGSERYVSELHPRLGDTVRVRLRLARTAPVHHVILRSVPNGEQSLMAMTCGDDDAPSQWWEGELEIVEPICNYRFIIASDDGMWHYNATGPTAYVPLDFTDFTILADYDPPGWPPESVFYQIFPDRFADGDPASNPRPEEYEYRGQRPVTYPWEEPPPKEQPGALVFYGGDLPGIQSKLDYLADLGVNALYLNPIFTALTNHKYDVTDYEHVDPHLGGDAALIALRRALDERGMRYILDMVPNHCGYYHSWFQKALADKDAPEVQYFIFHHHPEDYEGWQGVKMLPKLNYLCQDLCRHMFEGDDALFRRWLRPPYAADGWRIDVANMLGRQGSAQLSGEVGVAIRRAVRQSRSDAYLMGENFFDASGQLQGDQWDGVMNYDGFAKPVWYWLDGYEVSAAGLKEGLQGPRWSSETLADHWRSRLASIPWAVALQQFNLLDSHDTRRIRSTVGGNDALHRLAVALLLTFPGVPSIYYGDEIGMTDLPLLKSRGCMIWDETRWDKPLRDYHRALIALRRRSPALQRGGFQLLLAEEETLAYQRDCYDGRVLVFAHRAETPRPAGRFALANADVADGACFADPLGGLELRVEDGALWLPELAQGALILEQVV